MFYRLFIERYDARHPIPRPINAPYLPAAQASLLFMTAVAQTIGLAACSFGSIACLYWTGVNIHAEQVGWIVLAVAALVVAAIAVNNAYQIWRPYFSLVQRSSHGTARWATVRELVARGYARSIGHPLLAEEVRLGTIGHKYNFILSPGVVFQHLVFFGPTGSGKTFTYLMNLTLDWAETGSVIALDPKGEIYSHTAYKYKHVYRFDLLRPEFSDRWSLLKDCRGNPDFAQELANIILDIKSTEQTFSDPFFRTGAATLLTALLLHLAEIVDDPSPSMILEFLADPERDLSDINKEMSQSPSTDARLFWGLFTKSSSETRTSILANLNVACAPFRLPAVAQVMTPLKQSEREISMQGKSKHQDRPSIPREFDLTELREPSTAIYIVVPEGDAGKYKTVLTMLFSLAASNARKSSDAIDQAAKPPIMLLLDEAGNIPIHGLKELVGVGRGRKLCVALGYQTIGQVRDQYGRDGADAILSAIVTQVFLPGIKGETAGYASRIIGQATILSQTTVDTHGPGGDSHRLSEAGRALKDTSELRQQVEFEQAIVVTGTLPPVKLGFPPLVSAENKVAPPKYLTPVVVSFKEAERRKENRSVDSDMSKAKMTVPSYALGSNEKPGGVCISRRRFKL